MRGSDKVVYYNGEKFSSYRKLSRFLNCSHHAISIRVAKYGSKLTSEHFADIHEPNRNKAKPFFFMGVDWESYEHFKKTLGVSCGGGFVKAIRNGHIPKKISIRVNGNLFFVRYKPWMTFDFIKSNAERLDFNKWKFSSDYLDKLHEKTVYHYATHPIFSNLVEARIENVIKQEEMEKVIDGYCSISVIIDERWKEIRQWAYFLCEKVERNGDTPRKRNKCLHIITNLFYIINCEKLEPLVKIEEGRFYRKAKRYPYYILDTMVDEMLSMPYDVYQKRANKRYQVVQFDSRSRAYFCKAEGHSLGEHNKRWK